MHWETTVEARMRQCTQRRPRASQRHTDTTSSVTWLHHGNTICSLVPRPHPQKEERVWYTSSAYWGLLTLHFCRTNQTCGLHVIIMWHRAIANYCCTWEPLMHCHAKTMRYHDDHMTCCILCTQKALNVYQTLLLLGVVCGDNATLHIIMTKWHIRIDQ